MAQDINIIVENFMYAYMYELEKVLNSKQEELLQIKFQSDEANTDRGLKEYIKTFIETQYKKIKNLNNKVILNIINEKVININCNDLQHISISKVILKEDITDEIKQEISNANRVYTNPDLLFLVEFIKEKESSFFYCQVELKSTKDNTIPGSSVQQVDPNQWVIFVKRNSDKIEIITGQYLFAINNKMPFPDRSPRPLVSFKELHEWNKKNRTDKDNLITFTIDNDDSIEKRKLIQDWQEVLSKRWIDMLFSFTKKRKDEPWFNNNIRKFIISFLDKYETLDEITKKDFISQNKELIE